MGFKNGTECVRYGKMRTPFGVHDILNYLTLIIRLRVAEYSKDIKHISVFDAQLTKRVKYRRKGQQDKQVGLSCAKLSIVWLTWVESIYSFVVS